MIAGSVGGLNLFFNAVSWLAIFIVVACLCYFLSYGIGFVLIKFMPMLERFFRIGIALASTVLTLFAMAGIIFYLNLRRS